jgi:hypothetical protein
LDDDRPHLREARARQLAIYRRMTPAERLAAAMDLYWSARRLKEAALRALHPEWTDAQVAEAAKKAFMNARP